MLSNTSGKAPDMKAQNIRICAMVKESSTIKMEECIKVIFYKIKGNWRLNKMDGYGKLYYQSGKIAYEGSWNEDQFQGFGTNFIINLGKLYN